MRAWAQVRLFFFLARMGFANARGPLVLANGKHFFLKSPKILDAYLNFSRFQPSYIYAKTALCTISVRILPADLAFVVANLLVTGNLRRL